MGATFQTRNILLYPPSSQLYVIWSQTFESWVNRNDGFIRICFIQIGT